MPIHRTSTGLQISQCDNISMVKERPKVKMAFGTPRAYTRRKPTSFRLDPLASTYQRLQMSLQEQNHCGKEGGHQQRPLSGNSDSAMIAPSAGKSFHLPNDTSNQLDKINEYTKVVLKKKKVPLPPIRFNNVKNTAQIPDVGQGKLLLRKPRIPLPKEKENSGSTACHKTRPLGAIGKTDKNSSEITAKSKNFVPSNNPQELKYQKENNRIIIKAHSIPPQTVPKRPARFPDMTESLDRGSVFNITKNNTIILPRVELDQEANLDPPETLVTHNNAQTIYNMTNFDENLLMHNLATDQIDYAYTPSNSPAPTDDYFDEVYEVDFNTTKHPMSKSSSMDATIGSVITLSSSSKVTVKYPKRISKVTIGDSMSLSTSPMSKKLASQQSVSERNRQKAECLRRGSLRSPSLQDQDIFLDRAEMAKMQRIYSASNKGRLKSETSADRSVKPSKQDGRSKKVHKLSIGHPLYDSISKDELNNVDLDDLYDRGVYYQYLDTIREGTSDQQAKARKYLNGGLSYDTPLQPPPSMASLASVEAPEIDFRLVIEERRKRLGRMSNPDSYDGSKLSNHKTRTISIADTLRESDQSLLESEQFGSTSSTNYDSSSASSSVSQQLNKNAMARLPEVSDVAQPSGEDNRIRLVNVTVLQGEKQTELEKENVHHIHKKQSNGVCLILEHTPPSPEPQGQNQSPPDLELSRRTSSTSSLMTQPETDDIGSLPGSPYGPKMGLRRRSSSIDSCFSRPGSELLEVPILSITAKDKAPGGQDSPQESPSVSPTWSLLSEENHGDLQQQVVHRVSGPIVEHLPMTPSQSPDNTANDDTRRSLPDVLDASAPPAVSLTTDDGDDFAVWFGRRGSIFIEEKQDDDKGGQSLKPQTTVDAKGQVSLAVPRSVNN